MTDSLLLVLAGLLVGVVIGLTGVGSGSLMTPILVLLFGQPPAVAVGTDLVFSAVTKTLATGSFAYSRRVDWGIVWRLTLGSVPATGAVVTWLWSTRQRPEFLNAAILRYLAIILGLGALVLLLQVPIRGLGLRLTTGWLKRHETYTFLLTLLTVFAGAVLGATVALTSVGAGALGVVILLCLYPLRLSPDRLVATDIAQAVPVTLVAATGHAALGHVDPQVLGWLLLGSIPGVFIASRTAIRLPAALTRTLIGVMLALVSERMLFGS